MAECLETQYDKTSVEVVIKIYEEIESDISDDISRLLTAIRKREQETDDINDHDILIGYGKLYAFRYLERYIAEKKEKCTPKERGGGGEVIKHYYECDVCGKKLLTKIKQTPLGEVEIVCGTGTTKEWNTKGLFQHLCKECALTIDNGLLKTKMDILESVKRCGGD